MKNGLGTCLSGLRAALFVALMTLPSHSVQQDGLTFGPPPHAMVKFWPTKDGDPVPAYWFVPELPSFKTWVEFRDKPDVAFIPYPFFPALRSWTCRSKGGDDKDDPYHNWGFNSSGHNASNSSLPYGSYWNEEHTRGSGWRSVMAEWSRLRFMGDETSRTEIQGYLKAGMYPFMEEGHNHCQRIGCSDGAGIYLCAHALPEGVLVHPDNLSIFIEDIIEFCPDSYQRRAFDEHGDMYVRGYAWNWDRKWWVEVRPPRDRGDDLSRKC